LKLETEGCPKIQFRNSNLQELSENDINTISTFHNRQLVLHRKKVGRFLSIIETAEIPHFSHLFNGSVFERPGPC